MIRTIAAIVVAASFCACRNHPENGFFGYNTKYNSAVIELRSGTFRYWGRSDLPIPPDNKHFAEYQGSYTLANGQLEFHHLIGKARWRYENDGKTDRIIHNNDEACPLARFKPKGIEKPQSEAPYCNPSLGLK